MTLEQVAAEVGTDPTNLSRVEKGQQVPKRELARALFKFYGGTVDLGAIYDPEFHGTDDSHPHSSRTDSVGKAARA